MTCLLVTRPQPQADETARLIRDMGHKVLVEPLLTIEQLQTPISTGAFDGAVVTSIHSIAALQRVIVPARRVRFPVLAVGNNTCSSLVAAGFTSAQSADGTALDLVKSAPDYFLTQTGKNSSRIIYPSAEVTAHDLAMLAEGFDINIVNWPVYRSLPATKFSSDVTDKLSEGRIEGVLVYSSRTAQTFWTLFTRLETTVSQSLPVPAIYCLSQAIADTFPESRHIDFKIPCHPDQESLFQLLND